MTGAFRALRRRPFALLWSGQTVSRVGDFLYEFALAIWVRDATGSALMAGLVLLAALAPTVILTLFGGALVDRKNRVSVMLASDLGRGLVAGIVALLALNDALSLPAVFAASIIYGAIDAFFQPAYFAALPEVAPQEDLTSANALTSMSSQLGRVTGPPLGAFALANFGAEGAFGFNAATFLVSAALLLPLRSLVSRSAEERQRQPEVESAEPNETLDSDAPAQTDDAGDAPSAEEAPSFVAEIREGLGFVRSQPWIWVGTLVIAIGNIGLAGPFAVSMPFLFKDDLGLSDTALGIVLAFFPIGYVLAGLWIGRKESIRHRGWLAYGGSIAAGLCLAFFGLQYNFWPLMDYRLHPLVTPLCIAALINGAGLEAFAQVWMQSLQEMVPLEMMGRVSSIVELGVTAMLPVGFAVAGLATDWLGAPTVFIVGGLGTALVSAMALLHPAVRGLD